MFTAMYDGGELFSQAVSLLLVQKASDFNLPAV